MGIFSSIDYDQHEKVVFCHDRDSGLRAIIAIHNTNLGPSLGGLRMYPYTSDEDALKDVLRLSKGMTYKSALAGLPLGGGKAVIIGDPKTDKSDALFKAMGRFVEGLNGDYIIAQDSGIQVDDLNMIETQTKHISMVSERVDSDGKVCTPDPSPATAYGVFIGIKAAVKHQLNRDDVDGIKVAIQGVGNVGRCLAEHLYQAGAAITISDVNPQNISTAIQSMNLKVVENEAICQQEVDVFAPCAMGGIINEVTIEQIKASIIAGCANNQLSQESLGETLHQRGVLYAPDFVINAGGIIDVLYMREQKDHAEVLLQVEKIEQTLTEIFLTSAKDNQPTSCIAMSLAEKIFHQKQTLMTTE